MIVICNSSPLIGLARIEQLDILQKCFGEIIIPRAVWDEVVVQGRSRPAANALTQISWIKAAVVHNENLVLSLRQNLDAGEAECITLALEKQADLLIMDERLGRQTAQYLKIPHIGLVGVLIRAKHEGNIQSIKPILDRLRDVASFRIGDSLYQRVLQDESEL